MDIIINATSMTPIYEQIVDRIRALIQGGKIKAGEPLPSVRGLARQCAISALTAKKAYDMLEQEGLVVTVQGKGTFVADVSPNIVAEELNRRGMKVALTQFRYINPLPSNTGEIFSRYKNLIVAELNTGQFADYLQARFPERLFKRINKVEGQPFLVGELVEQTIAILSGKEEA